MPNRDAIFDILDQFDTDGMYEDAYQALVREFRIYLPAGRERQMTEYEAGFKAGQRGQKAVGRLARGLARAKPKRKLSAWQKFVKANSKKPRFKYKSGKKKGMVNLKALGVAYRKKRR